jgi:hypothetical protein
MYRLLLSPNHHRHPLPSEKIQQLKMVLQLLQRKRRRRRPLRGEIRAVARGRKSSFGVRSGRWAGLFLIPFHTEGRPQGEGVEVLEPGAWSLEPSYTYTAGGLGAGDYSGAISEGPYRGPRCDQEMRGMQHTRPSRNTDRAGFGASDAR